MFIFTQKDYFLNSLNSFLENVNYSTYCKTMHLKRRCIYGIVGYINFYPVQYLSIYKTFRNLIGVFLSIWKLKMTLE